MPKKSKGRGRGRGRGNPHHEKQQTLVGQQATSRNNEHKQLPKPTQTQQETSLSQQPYTCSSAAEAQGPLTPPNNTQGGSLTNAEPAQADILGQEFETQLNLSPQSGKEQGAIPKTGARLKGNSLAPGSHGNGQFSSKNLLAQMQRTPRSASESQNEASSKSQQAHNNQSQAAAHQQTQAGPQQTPARPQQTPAIIGSTTTADEHLARHRQENMELPKRPGYGREGRKIKLRANFFQVTLPNVDFLYHYDLEISPEKAPVSVCRDVVDAAIKHGEFKGVFNGCKPAFDGRRNLYCREPLPLKSEEASLKVTLPGTDGGKERKFTVSS